ncbi:MAG: hypothetical protein H6629_09570 [Calditrichae bacterium]|nr:hypothetical protein [Calditrichia bacterium]
MLKKEEPHTGICAVFPGGIQLPEIITNDFPVDGTKDSAKQLHFPAAKEPGLTQQHVLTTEQHASFNFPDRESSGNGNIPFWQKQKNITGTNHLTNFDFVYFIYIKTSI